MPAGNRPKQPRTSNWLFYARLAGGLIIVFGVAAFGMAIVRMMS